MLILMSSIECSLFIDSDNVYILRSWNSTLNWLNECGKDWRIISTWDFFFWLCFFYLLFFLWPLFMLAMGVILSLFLTRNWNWSRDSWALIEIKMLFEKYGVFTWVLSSSVTSLQNEVVMSWTGWAASLVMYSSTKGKRICCIQRVQHVPSPTKDPTFPIVMHLLLWIKSLLLFNYLVSEKKRSN